MLPLLSLMLLICTFFFFFIDLLKEPILVSLIFCFCLFSVSLILALIFLISFLLLIFSSICCYFSFFFFGHTHGMWKFLGQGLNRCQSCSLHHSYSGNTGCLACCTTKEIPYFSNFFFLSFTKIIDMLYKFKVYEIFYIS